MTSAPSQIGVQVLWQGTHSSDSRSIRQIEITTGDAAKKVTANVVGSDPHTPLTFNVTYQPQGQSTLSRTLQVPTLNLSSQEVAQLKIFVITTPSKDKQLAKQDKLLIQQAPLPDLKATDNLVITLQCHEDGSIQAAFDVQGADKQAALDASASQELVQCEQSIAQILKGLLQLRDTLCGKVDFTIVVGCSSSLLENMFATMTQVYKEVAKHPTLLPSPESKSEDPMDVSIKCSLAHIKDGLGFLIKALNNPNYHSCFHKDSMQDSLQSLDQQLIVMLQRLLKQQSANLPDHALEKLNTYLADFQQQLTQLERL